MSETDPWAGFTHDPRDPTNAGLRASDQERELVRQMLATGFADGRLDREEFDERSDAVGATRTLGELPALVSDLVPLWPVARRRRPRWWPPAPTSCSGAPRRSWASDRRNAVLGFVGPSLVCWAIWAATAFGDGGFEMRFPGR